MNKTLLRCVHKKVVGYEWCEECRGKKKEYKVIGITRGFESQKTCGHGLFIHYLGKRYCKKCYFNKRKEEARTDDELEEIKQWEKI